MRIYRGNIGIELSLNEFYELLADDERIEDTLDLIYDLEMDEAMNYNQNEIKEFEKKLFEELAEYQRKQQQSNDVALMRRILDRLEKYE